MPSTFDELASVEMVRISRMTSDHGQRPRAETRQMELPALHLVRVTSLCDALASEDRRLFEQFGQRRRSA
eukprot:1963103-Prymnesium_polylepis.2